MANLELRKEIKKSRLFHYEIADALGITEAAFSKSLRKELTAERKRQVLDAINQIKEVEQIV